MKISLNHNIAKMSGTSMLRASVNGGMNYVTFHKMATGKWNAKALDILAQFLSAIGYTPSTLRNVKFSEIFTVTDGKSEQQ